MGLGRLLGLGLGWCLGRGPRRVVDAALHRRQRRGSVCLHRHLGSDALHLLHHCRVLSRAVRAARMRCCTREGALPGHVTNQAARTDGGRPVTWLPQAAGSRRPDSWFRGVCARFESGGSVRVACVLFGQSTSDRPGCCRPVQASALGRCRRPDCERERRNDSPQPQSLHACMSSMHSPSNKHAAPVKRHRV